MYGLSRTVLGTGTAIGIVFYHLAHVQTKVGNSYLSSLFSGDVDSGKGACRAYAGANVTFVGAKYMSGKFHVGLRDTCNAVFQHGWLKHLHGAFGNTKLAACAVASKVVAVFCSRRHNGFAIQDGVIFSCYSF